MERRKFIQSAVCSVSCCSMGMSFFILINILDGSTSSINSKVPRDKTFSLELKPEVLKFYRNYSGWLKKLTERLGYENTLKVWQDAYQHYDETKYEAKQLIEITPPIMQIKKNYPTLYVWKNITAYDYIHLSLNGEALLVESLIKHFKRKGN
jgi:hypothetical protein